METEIVVFEEKMQKTVVALEADYITISAGRANPHVLDRIVVDYPDGWWADREYVWVSDIEHMDENVHHPFFTKQADSPTTGFYGVWVAASKDYNEAKRYVDSLVQDGFESDVYETTDWSNLNTEHWYVVSVGAYSTEEEAYEILSRVKNAGYAPGKDVMIGLDCAASEFYMDGI